MSAKLQGFDPDVRKTLIDFIERHSAMKDRRKIAAFDADGTLWRGDIGEAFFRWQLEQGTVPHAPKKDAWDYYFKETQEGDCAKAFGWLAQWNAGVLEADFKNWATRFFREQWAKNVFGPVGSLVNALATAGFEIWVVSGSTEWVVAAGAEAAFGVSAERVIGSAVTVENGRLTDKIARRIPYRDGKALLVDEVIGTRPLFAAGNTYWDKELLFTATELVLAVNSESEHEVNFASEQRLKEIAVERKWLVQGF
ncbi:MAG: haloacid dehalogenase-like hydrolase [Bdellovibrionota bacterium]